MRVYSARRSIYSGEDSIDVTPGTEDPIGRAILCPNTPIQTALWLRYAQGRASLIDVAALELFTAAQVSSTLAHWPEKVMPGMLIPVRPGQAALDVLARFARRVVVTCDCPIHSTGDGPCLRAIIATEIAKASDDRYLGDLQSGSIGRLQAKPLLLSVDNVTLVQWLSVLEMINDSIPASFLARYHAMPTKPVPAPAPTPIRALNIPPFCAVLGLKTWPATEDELMVAWRASARRTHPDRPGGSTRAFGEVKTAHEQALAALSEIRPRRPARHHL